jgi:hypothetical protein
MASLNPELSGRVSSLAFSPVKLRGAAAIGAASPATLPPNTMSGSAISVSPNVSPSLPMRTSCTFAEALPSAAGALMEA